MKKVAIIFIVLLLIALAFVFKDSAGTPDKAISPTQSKSLEIRESNEGTVIIAVMPVNLSDSKTWNFEITLDTHSGVLDADLVAVSELLDDQGKSYKPISWEGDGPEGHHRKGILKFNVIQSKPKSVELKIKNVGGIPERSFEWSI